MLLFHSFSLHTYTFDLAQTPGLPIDLDTAKRCLSAVTSEDKYALGCGKALSEYAAASWDALWAKKIGAIAGGEFQSMVNISRYIAGPAVGLWFIDMIKGLERNGLQEAAPKFVTIVALVWMLYANDAFLVRETIMATRGLINYQNSEVLESANQIEQFEDHLQELTDFNQARGILIQKRAECNGFTRNGEMLECLEEAKNAAEEEVKRYAAAHPNGGLLSNLKEYIGSAIDSPIDFIKGVIGDTVEDVLLAPVRGIAFVTNPIVEFGMQTYLAGLNGGIQYLIEVAWLFSAVVVPIPIAVALYPGGRSVLIGWLISFASLGFLKINLNIATSLVVSMLYARGPGDPVIDLMLLSLGTLGLAFGMTGLSAFATFIGIQQTYSAIAQGALSLAARAAGGIGG